MRTARMKVLVLGGTRYFGKRLVARLLEHGHGVTLLTRGQSPDEWGDRVQRLRGDRARLAEVAARGPWDLVFDQVGYTAADAREACRAFRGRVGRYVFTSSQSVYGSGLGLLEGAFDPAAHRWEGADAGKDTDYAEAKRQAEAVFAREADFPVAMARFPIVLGPDDYTDRLRWHVGRVRDGLPIAMPAPDARISFIHADDAGVGLMLLGDADVRGPVNLGSEAPISLRALIGEIERATGREARIEVPTPTTPDDARSPYGIPADWTMDTALARGLGFRARPIDGWLGGLVAGFTAKRLPA